MKNTVFYGAATAIVTPLTESGIDYEQFGRLIDWQIEAGIDAIVAVGTTGEGSTLTDEEHKEAIKFCVEKVAGRVPVIAGTGSNDTAYAVSLTQYACEVGADAMLLVTPYYNKATQKGMIASFKAVADVSTKPCILYNVPSRTGCNLTPASVLELADHPNIVAIKEASGNVAQAERTLSLCGDKIYIYSGNDELTVPFLSIGAKGVISVAANIVPKEMQELCSDYFEGKYVESANKQISLIPLIDALFSDINPVPIKEALNILGKDFGPCRLPLCEMEEAKKEHLRFVLEHYGIL